jgi:hypothetical protein
MPVAPPGAIIAQDVIGYHHTTEKYLILSLSYIKSLRPFTAATGVRIPVGTPIHTAG